MRHWFFAFLLFSCAPFLAQAQQPDPAPTDAVAMETVVVTGVQPGPGLWKVGKGDHVLWVLGTLSPLPEKMQWRADEVGERIAQSQAVLAAPDVFLKADVGFFGRLALLPSLIGLRNNPEGKKLDEVVPADLYARWQPLKARYLGRGGKVEKWRPLFAAMELYKAAIRRNGMTVGAGAIKDRIDEFAKRAKIEPTPVQVVVEIDHPRDAIKTFKKSGLDDVDCFARTLDRIETDLGTMKRRANAWATGDLDALRALPYTNQYVACSQAIQRAGALRDAGDLDARLRQAWIDAAEKTLAAHASSFAVLPMDAVLGKDSYLAGLRARGCSVESPDAQDDQAAGP